MLAVRGVATVHRDAGHHSSGSSRPVHVAHAAGRPRSLRTAARQSEARGHRGATRRHRGEPRLRARCPATAAVGPRRERPPHGRPQQRQARPGRAVQPLVQRRPHDRDHRQARRFRLRRNGSSRPTSTARPPCPYRYLAIYEIPEDELDTAYAQFTLAAGGTRRGDGRWTRASRIRVGHARSPTRSSSGSSRRITERVPSTRTRRARVTRRLEGRVAAVDRRRLRHGSRDRAPPGRRGRARPRRRPVGGCRRRRRRRRDDRGGQRLRAPARRHGQRTRSGASSPRSTADHGRLHVLHNQVGMPGAGRSRRRRGRLPAGHRRQRQDAPSTARRSAASCCAGPRARAP